MKPVKLLKKRRINVNFHFNMGGYHNVFMGEPTEVNELFPVLKIVMFSFLRMYPLFLFDDD